MCTDAKHTCEDANARVKGKIINATTNLANAKSFKLDLFIFCVEFPLSFGSVLVQSAPVCVGGRSRARDGLFCFATVDQRSRLYPTNTRRWPNGGLMLGQRRRRWANISPTLGQRFVFAGIIAPCKQIKIQWPIPLRTYIRLSFQIRAR